MKIAAACLTLALMACGGAGPKPFVFEPSSVTPAASGQVATATGPNGNTKLSVKVAHLAPPDRVAPGATVYVVWVTELEEGSAARSLGALQVDANLSGALESTTPLRSFDLSITAEATATVAGPSTSPVLKVRIIPQS